MSDYAVSERAAAWAEHLRDIAERIDKGANHYDLGREVQLVGKAMGAGFDVCVMDLAAQAERALTVPEGVDVGTLSRADRERLFFTPPA